VDRGEAISLVGGVGHLIGFLDVYTSLSVGVAALSKRNTVCKIGIDWKEMEKGRRGRTKMDYQN